MYLYIIMYNVLYIIKSIFFYSNLISPRFIVLYLSLLMGLLFERIINNVTAYGSIVRRLF